MTAFRTIASPAQCLKIIFLCLSAFRNRDNMIDFKQKVGFGMAGVTTAAASKIVASFDMFTQFWGHERSLFFRKGTCSKSALQYLDTTIFT